MAGGGRFEELVDDPLRAADLIFRFREVNSLQAQRDMVMMRDLHCTAGQRNQHNSKHQRTAWSVLMTRGDEGNERAYD